MIQLLIEVTGTMEHVCHTANRNDGICNVRISSNQRNQCRRCSIAQYDTYLLALVVFQYVKASLKFDTPRKALLNSVTLSTHQFPMGCCTEKKKEEDELSFVSCGWRQPQGTEWAKHTSDIRTPNFLATSVSALLLVAYAWTAARRYHFGSSSSKQSNAVIGWICANSNGPTRYKSAPTVFMV